MFKRFFIVLSLLSLIPGYTLASDFKLGKPFVQLGHSNGINAAVVSPDGRYVLTGGSDKTLKLWDIQISHEIKTLYGHKSTISRVAYGALGQYVVSGDNSGKIKLWDIFTGKEIRHFEGHSEGVTSVQLINKDKYILSTSSNGTVRIWDVETGENTRKFDVKSSTLKTAIICSDGDTVIAGSDIGEIYFWSIKDGKMIKSPQRYNSTIPLSMAMNTLAVSMVISSDGKKAAFGCIDKNIRVVDIESGNVLKVLKGHNDRILSVSFTNNTQQLVSSSWDKSINLWDLSTGKVLKSFSGHSKGVASVQTIINDKYILSGSWDQSAKIWSIKTGKIVRDFKGSSQAIASVAVSPDSQYVLAGGIDNSLRLWSTQESKEIKVFKGHSDIVISTTFSPNRKYAASGGFDESIILWDVFTGRVLKTFRSGQVGSVNFDHSGDYLVSSGNDAIQIWDVQSGRLANSIEGHRSGICTVRFSNDGKRILSGGKDGTLKLWDIKTGREIRTFFDGYNDILSAQFSPDGKEIISVDGNELLLFDVRSGKKLQEFYGHSGDVISVSFTPNGKYILSGSKDGSLKLWDKNKERAVKTFKGHFGVVFSVAVSPDGRYGVSGGIDGTVRYWDLKTGKELLTTISFSNGEWVSITPSGYFNTSKNGAKFLTILTGSMEVSSIDQYYESFYRPDIVATALTVENDKPYAVKIPAIKLADVKPAPKVEIVKTKEQTDKETLNVTIKITPNSSGIGQIRLYLDDALIKTDGDRALKKKSNQGIYKSYSIKLPKGTHIIKAVVFNEANTMASKAAKFKVVSTYNPIVKPDIYAIVIGINDYNNPSISLKYAVADAKLFAKTIQSKTINLFGQINVKQLTTKAQTTKENITNELNKLQDISPNDLFIFYVASHGMVEDTKYHMITSNVGALSSRGIKREAIMQDDLKDMIANIPTSKKIIILDTCNSGALGQALEVAMLTRGLNETTAMKVLSRAVGSTIISASSSTQEALEGYKGHGLLTYVLSEGLNGKADSDRDGFVKTLEIANYVEDTVPQIAEDVFKRAQYPYVSPLGQGFPIVRVK